MGAPEIITKKVHDTKRTGLTKQGRGVLGNAGDSRFEEHPENKRLDKKCSERKGGGEQGNMSQKLQKSFFFRKSK